MTSDNATLFPSGSHTIVPRFDWENEVSSSDCTSQEEALYYMLRGDNVLLCGQAGTGKSWVVSAFRTIIDDMNAYLAHDSKEIRLSVTASTGAAASLVGGTTIHSWSGLGIDLDAPRPDDTDETGTLVVKSRKWKYALKRIKATQILIIDEISMLPAYFLTNLDTVCRMAKGKDAPFGGIQVIMVGDFLQLPPVNHHDLNREGEEADTRMCFFSPAFGACHPTYCYLDTVRRSDDNRLTDLLNAIRSGTVPAEQVQALMSRKDAPERKNGSYTLLYTMNRDVSRYNTSKLAELGGQTHTFVTKTGGDDRQAARQLKRNGGIPDSIDLKRNAIVMLTSNNADEAHVNGSIGTVVGFSPSLTGEGDDGVLVRFNDGVEATISMARIDRKTKELVAEVGDDGFPTGRQVIKERTDAYVSYLPLKLAWAITVHKSQGQTVDGAIIDLSRCFQPGLGYVAISRVHSLDDIILKGELPPSALRLEPSAFSADSIIRRKAKEGRKRLLETVTERENKEKVIGLLSGTERRRAERWLRDNPVPSSLLHDDMSVHDLLLTRAVRIRKK